MGVPPHHPFIFIFSTRKTIQLFGYGPWKPPYWWYPTLRSLASPPRVWLGNLLTAGTPVTLEASIFSMNFSMDFHDGTDGFPLIFQLIFS